MFQFDNVVNNLWNLKSSMLRETMLEDIECPICKSRLSDLKDTSFVGCSNCYKVFREAVRQLAYRYHGRVEHLGKLPVVQIDRTAKLKEIDRLEKLKKQYADADEFEQAKAIKRKIDQLRSELK